MPALNAHPFIHSVSLAHFDIAIGNTISCTWPESVNLKEEVVQQNMHDMCFPDGAHDTHRDTVYAVCDKVGGGHLYVVGCYRSVKCEGVKRGAVQRGVLILTHMPLFGCLEDFAHNLLRWWLCGGGEGTNPINPVTAAARSVPQSPRAVGSPRSPSPKKGGDDSLGNMRDWVDVASHLRSHGVLEATPRDPSSVQDVSFVHSVYSALTAAFDSATDGDRHRVMNVTFATKVTVPLADDPTKTRLESVRYTTELTAPFPEAPIADQLSFGCSVSGLVRTFKQDTAKLYTALLHRRTLCFVGGTAAEVSMAVLSCCHMVRPMCLLPCEVSPYFTVTDASKIEQQPFCVVGSTNPFYEDTGRNRWATAICNVTTGAVTLVSNKNGTDENLPAGALGGLPTVTKQAQRLVAHVVEGVLQENRTEAWVRNFFEWSNAKILSNLLQDGKTLPLLEIADRPRITKEVLERSIEQAEAITVTVTKCHEANKKKTKIHSDWFTTILEVMRPVCQRSGEEQGEMFDQIAGCCLDDALSGFRDITVDSCGSKTERAAIAQLAYEESKTRLLVTELRERVHLLLDSINSQRNRRAFCHEDNQLFCDMFNTPDYQFYNLQAQVLLYSTNCVVENRTHISTGVVHNGQVYSSSQQPTAKLDINSSFSFSESANQQVTRCSGKLFISKNYLCFAAGWRARVGKSSKEKREVSSIEIIPFDAIERVASESSVVSDGIHLKLITEAPNVFVSLYISSLSDTYKLLTLLETLSEKQKRTRLLLGALDPVLNVPNITEDPVRSPIGIERRIAIPCGLYLYERLVTEEVYELARFYPVVGWRTTLMPHDPPSCCDRSGKYERRFSGKKCVALPEGWSWLGEWASAEWEYNTDFKSKPTQWKSTHSKLDICRRRRWTRVRRLEHDALGTPLPTMMLPSDYPIEDSSPQDPMKTSLPAIPSEEACDALDQDEPGSPVGEAEASTTVHPFRDESDDKGGTSPRRDSSASPQAVSPGDSMSPAREASVARHAESPPPDAGRALPLSPTGTTPRSVPANASFGVAPSVRCRQNVQVEGARSDKKALSAEVFGPGAVLPQCEVSELGLKDFDKPVGRFSPFHETSALPGCGAEHIGTELPGNPHSEQVPVDALIAEANGLPVSNALMMTVNGTLSSNTSMAGSPAPGVLPSPNAGCDVLQQQLSNASLADMSFDFAQPPKKSGVRKFKEELKQDLKDLKHDLKTTLKSSDTTTDDSHVSKGVVLVNADSQGNPVPGATAISPFSAAYTEEDCETSPDTDAPKSSKLVYFFSPFYF